MKVTPEHVITTTDELYRLITDAWYLLNMEFEGQITRQQYEKWREKWLEQAGVILAKDGNCAWEGIGTAMEEIHLANGQTLHSEVNGRSLDGLYGYALLLRVDQPTLAENLQASQEIKVVKIGDVWHEDTKDFPQQKIDQEASGN